MNETEHAVLQLSALAHEERLNLIRLLIKKHPSGLAQGELSNTFGRNLKTTSAQLAVLKKSGLVETRREGRSIIYSANIPEIRELLAFLMKDCCQSRLEILKPLKKILTKR